MNINLVTIPAGKFQMGSAEDEVSEQIDNNPDTDKRLFKRQLTKHEVNLSKFQISKYPITNNQFSKFVNSLKYTTTAEAEGWGFHFEDGEMKEIKGASWKNPHGRRSNIINKDNHPVVMVSWFDAIEFCRWLSEETGKNFTLPTEAQWEKSARGTKGNTWPWGNKWDESKCNCENKIGTTTPVGKYSPKGNSPYGCADMAGNILEWTSTTIGTRDPWPTKYQYPYNPYDGREDLEVNTRRVARGGTYQRGADMCRSAFRFADMPGDRYSSMGFRVVSTSQVKIK